MVQTRKDKYDNINYQSGNDEDSIILDCVMAMRNERNAYRRIAQIFPQYSAHQIRYRFRNKINPLTRRRAQVLSYQVLSRLVLR
ncbi:5661_t:CDS:2 [Funneliformis mosseae]|uniref:5661_t:CDS:1 n=1 Tax=Funneliformis mosseae TaxID=27381 RepID=A0A9N9HC99_FUNMO|nr:5661_t:CDS:2 [Funneliformis mosseae]